MKLPIHNYIDPDYISQTPAHDALLEAMLGAGIDGFEAQALIADLAEETQERARLMSEGRLG